MEHLNAVKLKLIEGILGLVLFVFSVVVLLCIRFSKKIREQFSDKHLKNMKYTMLILSTLLLIKMFIYILRMY